MLSQPSLPFPLSKKFKADIGISDGDLAQVKERTAAGTCLLGLRFTNDPFCFEERFETLRRELGDAFIAVEIDSAPGNPHGHPKQAHSVLTEHLVDEEGTPTRAALDQTLTFFREKLGVGSGPGPAEGPAGTARPAWAVRAARSRQRRSVAVGRPGRPRLSRGGAGGRIGVDPAVGAASRTSSRGVPCPISS